MEDFKNINLTKHCLVRYLNRFKGIAVTENNYDIWKNNHADEVKNAEKEIKIIFFNSDYITTGTYGIHKKASFYIERNVMATFVVVDEKIVTVYSADFGLDTEGNRQLLNVLEDNLKRFLNEEEVLQVKNKEYLDVLNKNENIILAEIQQKEAELQNFRNKKKEIEAAKNSIKSSEQLIASKINAVREKIILSKKAL